MLLGALGVASLAAAAAVLLAPVDVALLGAATSGRPPANGALGPPMAYIDEGNWSAGLGTAAQVNALTDMTVSGTTVGSCPP